MWIVERIQVILAADSLDLFKKFVFFREKLFLVLFLIWHLDRFESTSCIHSFLRRTKKRMDEKNRKRAEQLLAGGVAGMVSRTCISPIERCKIVYQINRGQEGYFRLFGQLVRSEGVLSLWKGNGVAVFRIVPYMSSTFLAFEEYKRSLAKLNVFAAGASPLLNLSAGALAGMTACTLCFPLDVVRAQLAMQAEGAADIRAPKYAGIGDALVKIFQRKGFVRGWYAGLTPTLAGVIPYAGIKFSVYEGFKDVLVDRYGYESEAELPVYMRMLSGAGAGAFAQTFVYPLDIVRRRMQTHQGAAPLYNSLWHALSTIAREEGIKRGLYRGLTLNFTKTIPNVCLYMSIYDMAKQRLTRYRVDE
jgi:Mitochondrial carrier protein